MKESAFKRGWVILGAIGIVLLLAACSVGEGGHGGENLLAVSPKGSEAMDRDKLTAALAEAARATDRRDDLHGLLPKVLGNNAARSSVVSINRVEDDKRDAYAGVLVFDAIPDDDSVGGYRYDLQLDRDVQGGWKITEAMRSWRCWKDRGHRHFSTEPCV